MMFGRLPAAPRPRSSGRPRRPRRGLAWPTVAALVAIVCAACAPGVTGADNSPTPASTPSPTQPAGALAPPVRCPTCWVPTPTTSWQVQFVNGVDTSVNANVFVLDTFDTDASIVKQLHAMGRKTVCYIDAGAWERWRPDSGSYPSSVLAGPDGWSGERWVDIRQISVLAPIIEARLNLCKSKGFDGVIFDNVNGYTNNTGLPLTYQDQLRYNVFLANAAHARQLSAGLLNDLDQAPVLVNYFDWSQNEQCFRYKECQLLQPFISAGKAVMDIEYDLQPAQYCPEARAMHITAMRKNRTLDAYRVPCP
jgi:hypothetical protein